MRRRSNVFESCRVCRMFGLRTSCLTVLERERYIYFKYPPSYPSRRRQSAYKMRQKKSQLRSGFKRCLASKIMFHRAGRTVRLRAYLPSHVFFTSAFIFALENATATFCSHKKRPNQSRDPVSNGALHPNSHLRE